MESTRESAGPPSPDTALEGEREGVSHDVNTRASRRICRCLIGGSSHSHRLGSGGVALPTSAFILRSSRPISLRRPITLRMVDFAAGVFPPRHSD